ncbi:MULTISPECIES: DUF4199 domain-containing protein [Salegentibacter]|jgi:hypothetical protein|uniref:DUF4199 domain-containing protein n=2 Tax=Salegentibacter TaxID=143222 RepID=A0A1I2JUF3_9FLAO|nr:MULTISPECIES: DUF4199 domain-containing protein [Salegentibacter]APS39036.1 hypothetical protein AO058_09205 [Salegentibacter sp. T436]MBO2544502.1 DUF4199 domain-containing protein [Salegentibacter sp. BDJ18]SFF57809.1 Protein of unknown function [Salegentibacter agarivorans]|tara:strand:+ start:425 stop:901 length:477 start_codon:yes stop_codon:yes gene_type:complete
MKNYQIEIKWGVIFFAASLLWMYFEKLMGWHDVLIAKHAIYTNFFGLIAIAIYFFAIHDKRKNFFRGKMSWRQGFVSGVILSIVIALLSPIGQLITHYLISPEYFENAIESSVERNAMKQEDAEAYFNLSSYIVQSIAGALMMGVVTSAIVALILRKK